MRDWRRPRAHIATPVGRAHADRVVVAVRPVAQTSATLQVVSLRSVRHDPEPIAVLDVEVAQPGGVGLEARVVAGPGPAHVVAGPAGTAVIRAIGAVWSSDSVMTTDPNVRPLDER